MVTLISSKCSDEIVSWKKDSHGRIVSILIRSNGVDVNLVNIYAPTNLAERKIFFDSLHEFFIPSDAIIIGGDFNCYDNVLDKFGGNVSIHKEYESLKNDFALVDVWRNLHPGSREFTWFNSSLSIGSRLDKFLVSRELLSPGVECNISPCPISDHDFVSFVFDIPTGVKRGPGVWNFNNSLLKDKDFCTTIEKLIDCHLRFLPSFASLQDWWEFLKLSIKEESIAFSRNKRRRLRKQQVYLTNKLIRLRQRLVDGDDTVSVLISDTESQLKALRVKEIEGIMIRSRAQWLEEGEQPSRYFFNLQRIKAQRSHISSVYDLNGTEVSSQEEIEKAHVDFYSRLFSEEPVDAALQDDLLSSLPRQLSSDQASSCEGQMTLDEMTFALRKMNSNKAPGPDGLSVEFYVKFWDRLGPYLCRVLNACYRAGEMCESMKSSNTRVIFKKGDRKNLKNWRPISLLNVDYKICSKVLSLRLSKVLEFIVDPDQTCSVPGCKITSNLHILRDVLDHIDRTNETGILISLDQEKAFDRVNRTFLLNLLSRFGFGPSFCFWINTLYNGANMRIIVNEWLSGTVLLSRGVRQGDSLSPLLYILCVETLACKVRNNPDIEGFLLPGARGLCYKVGVYADDTTCIVKSYRSLQVLFNMINVYEGGSGARLNVAKTEAMWLGAWRSRGDQPLGLKWVTKMKILGVVFGLDTDADNWRPKLEKLEKHLNLWKSRSLSLVGRSLIVNVLGISKLLYLSAVLCVPKWVISKINNLVWPFLWGSRMETVSRMTCHQSLGKGGLGIFNFQTKSDSLKLASLVSILDDRESKSFFLTKYFLGSRLAPCRPEWRSLRDNSTPSTQNLTPYYEKCFSILASLRGIVSRQEWRDFVFSSKKCYLALLRENSASPILHRFWSAFLPIDFDLDRFWVSVRDGFSENYKNDILWLIVLRAVKVRDSLKNWGYIDSDKCASCSRKETIDHCFLNCVRVKSVWSFFSPVLSSLLGFPFLPSCTRVFFFRWAPVSPKKTQLARFLIKTILYGVWKFRNKATFHNGNDTPEGMIRYILGDVRNRVACDFFSASVFGV